MKYIALCTGGLEEECKADLLLVPGISQVDIVECKGGTNEIIIYGHSYYQGESGCGKLLVEADLATPPSVPSVLCWLVYIAHTHVCFIRRHSNMFVS